MHDLLRSLPDILTSVATLIGAVVVLYKAYGTSHKNNFSEMNEEMKQKKEDAEVYRERWLEAEKGNDKLRKEVDRLRKELNDANK